MSFSASRGFCWLPGLFYLQSSNLSPCLCFPFTSMILLLPSFPYTILCDDSGHLQVLGTGLWTSLGIIILPTAEGAVFGLVWFSPVGLQKTEPWLMH